MKTLTLLLVLAAVSGLDPALFDLVSAAGAVGASLALGFLKTHTAALDGAIGKAIKPLQPAIVLGVGLGLPWLTARLGIAGGVDAAVFVTAPTATILAVTARELRRRVFGAAPS
jgi:hypothetical protein